jgi:hypothetical protein
MSLKSNSLMPAQQFQTVNQTVDSKQVPFVVVECLPTGDAELASRWLAAAIDADRMLSRHCLDNPEFKSAIERLGAVYAVEFSPAALAFVHFWLNSPSAFALNLFDSEWGENFAFMAATGFFTRRGQHYQMTHPHHALTTERIARALLRLAATEDDDHYLHPESILTTTTKAEANRSVLSIKRVDRKRRMAISTAALANPAE